MKTQTYLICALTFVVSTSLAAIEELPRRANWQGKIAAPQELPGAVITAIDEGSPLATAGLQIADKLLAIDGHLLRDADTWYDIRSNVVGERTYKLTYQRGAETQVTDVTFTNIPLERYANVDVKYGHITSDFNVRQRTILTIPRSERTKLPAIFVVQGLSCSSIEYTPGRTSNFIRLLQDLVTKTGMVVMRVEKPGLGDSEGKCSQTDFNTELNGYETALKTLMAHPRVDAKRIIIYGSSMGSAVAPVLANRLPVKGIISDGTYLRTWFEHMLEIERRIKAMQGNGQADIHRMMTQAYIPLYYGMLIEKKSYGELIEETPLLGSYNYHGLEHMYGRPMAFYHQLQELDIPGAWQQLKVPARIRWGSNDWIMSEADNHMIVDILNKAGHSDHQLFIHPGLDHWDTIHESADSSFHGRPGRWDDSISQVIVDWAKALVR